MDDRCPRCASPFSLDQSTRCPQCSLDLDGELAQRLRHIAAQIAALESERATLLAPPGAPVFVPPSTLAPTADPSSGVAPAPPATPPPTAPPPDPPAPVPPPPVMPPPPIAPAPNAASATPIRASRPSFATTPQTLLAIAGVTLLAIAAIVFTAVTWTDLSLGVRTAIMVAATAGATALTVQLARRGLDRTAEATAVLSLAFGAVMLSGAWHAGWADWLRHADLAASVATVILIGAAHGLHRLSRTRSPLVIATALIPIGVHGLDSAFESFGGSNQTRISLLAWAAFASGSAMIAHARRYIAALPRWSRLLQGWALLEWIVASTITVAALWDTSLPHDPNQLPYWFSAALAVVMVTGWWWWANRVPRSRWAPISIFGAWLVGTLSIGGVLRVGDGDWYHLRFTASAALGVAMVGLTQRTAKLPRALHSSALMGTMPMLIGALAATLRLVLWLALSLGYRTASPWRVTTVDLQIDQPSWILIGTSLLAVVIIVAAMWLSDLRAEGSVIALIGVSLTLFAAADVIWPIGGVTVMALLVALGAAIGLVRIQPFSVPLTTMGATTLMAVVFSVSSRSVSVVAALSGLAIAIIAQTALTRNWEHIQQQRQKQRPAPIHNVDDPHRLHRVDGAIWPFSFTAGLCSALAMLSVGVSIGALSDDPVMASYGVALLAALTWIAWAPWPGHLAIPAVLNVIGGLGFATAMVIVGSEEHIGGLAAIWIMVSAAAAITFALHRDATWAVVVSSVSAPVAWILTVRAFNIDTVEAYSIPLGLAMSVFGIVQLRRDAPTPSWLALGPGLLVMAMPTVLQVLGDPDDIGRVAALLIAAPVVAWAGWTYRLRAPVVIGPVVAVIVALSQLGVVSAILPRWTLLAIAGAVLLGLSITYESHLQRLRSLRGQLATMR